jgi:hypothetical protein
MFEKVLEPSFELVSEQIENTKKENKWPVSVRQPYPGERGNPDN